ncbi:MAG: methyltransferase [Chthonomonadales bacterium]|nr:methyltransferase [Chthonomonadales bacterium]
MGSTPREIVLQTLEFRNPPRAPRQLWLLQWALDHHAAEVDALRRDFPDDIAGIGGHHRELPKTSGNPHIPGEYVDEWGAVFTNIHAGVIGEVKHPVIEDWDTDVERVHFPREWLTIDRDAVNRDCAATDRFTMAGMCPRPFEQAQFLRGSENLYADLASGDVRLLAFLRRMHELYVELVEKWVQTDVDGISFMDDWGAQRGLLIRPAVWREVFKPMYRDYVQIAHAAGKKAFMHSDGHILAIYPDLVEIGVDAVNSQLFCMGVANLAPFAGKITFWGEIDRQNLLPHGTVEDIERAVEEVHTHLWRNGGCFAQCEFGAGARPENVRRVFETWDRLTSARYAGG